VTTSRRTFFRSLGIGTAAGVLWPLASRSQPRTFEPFNRNQNDAFIRLNSNENAYGPSPKVAEAIRSAVGSANRYSRMEYASLIEQVANINHVKSEQVLLGCGSTETLRMAAFAFLSSGKRLVQAVPTFEGIEDYSRAVGAEVISVRLTSTFAHDLDAMLARANSARGLIYICNPNNPTASLTPRKELEDFINRLPASMFVVIDEAYHHYAGQSAMYASFLEHPLDDERIIVTRTFSKVYGLAGLRLGYAVASPRTIQQMRKFATEDNINAVATQAADVALADNEALDNSIQRNSNDRQEFFNQAMARSLKPIDSHANYVMMNTFHPADGVIEHFRSNNILIGRRFPPMDTYVRISLGRPEEMNAFWRTWDMLPWSKNIMHH
jgi:histidinol-phosphate aminotransferase